MIDLLNFEEDAGYFALFGRVNGQFGQGEVLHPLHRLVLEQFVDHIDGQRGQVADVFQNRDGQFALDDAVAAISSGVLARNRHLAGQSLGLHGLERAEGGAVIRSDNRIDIVAGSSQQVFHQLESVGGVPVLDALLGDDFDDALIDVGLQDFGLALGEQGGVVVGGGTGELDDAHLAVGGHIPGIRADGFHYAQGLLAAHFDVVEGQVGCDFRGLDEPVVGNNFHTGIGGLVNRGHNRIAVFCNDNQGLDALADHVVNLVVLEFDIMIGFLADNLVAFFFQEFAHQNFFVLPALSCEI